MPPVGALIPDLPETNVGSVSLASREPPRDLGDPAVALLLSRLAELLVADVARDVSPARADDRGTSLDLSCHGSQAE